MPRAPHLHQAVPVVLAGVLLLTACGSGNPLAPENQLEVSNTLNNFELQVSDMDNVSDSLSYTWTNTSTQATVDVSSAITGGNVTLTVTDAAGTEVYRDDLAHGGDATTALGVVGQWTIEVRIDKASGTFSVRMQNRT